MREPIIDTMQVAGIEFDLAEIRRKIESVRNSGTPGGLVILVNVNDETGDLPVGKVLVIGHDDMDD